MTGSPIPAADLMSIGTASVWSEAANRRLRALLWKGHPVAEIAFLLGRPLPAVATQLRALGLGS